jgi:hypothetical protein
MTDEEIRTEIVQKMDREKKKNKFNKPLKADLEKKPMLDII